MLEYSVIIRTIGKAGEKYQNLLDSISRLEPQPKEVIVVLPEGYEKPKEQLGWETFYYSPKGMVAQRMCGIYKCKTPYALICDDDVSFDSDFVQKLYEPVELHLGGISIAPLYSFLPQKGVRAFVDAITGAALPTIFHRDRYTSVLRTSGYSYNRSLNNKKKYYETQSAAWTLFFADVNKLRKIDFDVEQVWLDKGGYSAMDDQTMFYKAWLRGIKTIVVSDAYYEHQDAKTSTKNNKSAVLRCLIVNRIIFWHRFIWCAEKSRFFKLWSRICFGYRMMWIRIWSIGDVLRGRCSKEDLKIVLDACVEGWKYVKSQEYKNLESVCED